MFSLLGNCEASWLDSLVNPHLSMWDPVAADASMEVVKLGFTNFDGYAAAFGDFNSDSL